MFHLTLDVLRYLIVLRSNATLANAPLTFSAEFLDIVGNAIADQLPTVQARPWRKSLGEWNRAGGGEGVLETATPQNAEIPLRPWPIDAVVHKYPGKRSFGRDELLFIELKLIGSAADHGFFLEVILPAVEASGRTSSPQIRNLNRIWGAYDVLAVYVAGGSEWRPIAEEGRIDLSFRPKPGQWIEDLKLLRTEAGHLLDKINWLTPFAPIQKNAEDEETSLRMRDGLPKLSLLFDQLVLRLESLMPGKDKSIEGLLAGLSEEEILLFNAAYDVSNQIPILRTDTRPATYFSKRYRTGVQIFATSMLDYVIPFLTLASILHVGQYTQYGFGTFIIE